MSDIVALDLFAGTGWGVACKRLGIEEGGVELMEEAVATRTANGMKTLYRDVWDGLLLSVDAHALLYGIYSLLIASPPCQTFSAAGNGAGRKALNEVLEAIREEAYKDPAALLAFGEKHDMRTALVLTPLAYVWRDRPQYVVLEQVPTVQPVWEEYARVMRQWGYTVETAILNAEQYGVPQTRRRSILVANLNGPISLPAPTHSKYYPRDPKRLDPGVLPWVSMAQALGWGMTGRPYLTITGGGDKSSSKHAGDPSPSALGSAGSRDRVTAEYEAGRWIEPDTSDRQLRTPSGELKMLASELATLQTYPATDVYFTQNNRQANQARRSLDQPAPTVTAGHDSNNRGFLREDGTVITATPEQVAALQSYPQGVVYRNGNQANAARRSPDQPAPTVHFGQRLNKVEWIAEDLAGDPAASGVPVSPEEASALQSYPVGEGWGFTARPATTVTGHGEVTRCSTGSKQAVVNAVEAGEYLFKPPFTPETAIKPDYQPQASGYLAIGEKYEPASISCSPEENALIQSYPVEPKFVWCGSRSKVFLQIGNAVPPLLAQAILESALILE